MASTSYVTDTLTIDPPLNRREIVYLRRLNRSAESRTHHRPGYHCPWQASDDGTTLSIFEEYGTKEPIAEWVAYLATHLFGPDGPALHGRALKGFTYDHVISGRVDVQGRGQSDKWILESGPEGVTVTRQQLPCPACWAELLLMARPTNAYRFQHPVRAANLIDGGWPDLDPAPYEDDCRAGAWTPVGSTTRTIEWPWMSDYFEGWWIDLAATPDAVPFRWDIAADADPGLGGVVVPFPEEMPPTGDGFDVAEMCCPTCGRPA